MYDQTDLRLALVAGNVLRKPLTWYRMVRRIEHWLHPGDNHKGLRGRLFNYVKRYRLGLDYD